MKVIVRELGSRPSVMTPARLQAPQGAKVLADLLAEEDFADLCTLSVDWEGDGHTPVLTVYTVKFMPEYAPENLQHFWPIDMEDAFGGDAMDNETLRNIVQQLRDHFNEMVQLRKRQESMGRWYRPGEKVIYGD